MNMPSNPGDFNDLVSPELKTTSRIIAERFDKEHYVVLRAIRDLVEKNPEWGAVNFVSFKINDLTGESTGHYEMTRDGYTMLVMGFTGRKAMEWKIRFLEAFNAMEARLRASQSPAIPDFRDPAVVLGVIGALQGEVEQARAKVLEYKPKAEALDRLAGADGSYNLTEAAKALNMRPKDLRVWLHANRWIYRRSGGRAWLGYSDKCQQQLLEHKSTTVELDDGRTKMVEQVRITAKGMTRLDAILNDTSKTA